MVSPFPSKCRPTSIILASQTRLVPSTAGIRPIRSGTPTSVPRNRSTLSTKAFRSSSQSAAPAVMACSSTTPGARGLTSRPGFYRGFTAVGKTLADVKEFAALVRWCERTGSLERLSEMPTRFREPNANDVGRRLVPAQERRAMRILATAIIALLSGFASAQTDSPPAVGAVRISGRVVDPTGASIANAAVRLKLAAQGAAPKPRLAAEAPCPTTLTFATPETTVLALASPDGTFSFPAESRQTYRPDWQG